ncbi:L-threonylcarbamoyladenylate synthase [Roseicyclus sp. F158]|uniref:Threonylcarbamoyl-AMP synthase n=1 Tax=Tropicimonas omnivorans TaxID=3075590 RepID=A0ABU3DCM5_9RHOB|nr:L-threonylcarbamoyladenylate synthase [Roseicyclus sp. F158]MDT0681314.1 L-threonylcarbamoyladenylate synthase [Roseicyclus sp. F158]
MDRKTALLASDASGIARAAELLRQGGLVALPTETVYGLGGDATNGEAVAGIFAAKGRPSFNPLIVHLPDAPEAGRYAVLSPEAEALAERFWPGPLTLVLPMRADTELSPLVSAGLPNVALRVPALRLARQLLRETGRPVAAPSANRSGRVSPTRAAHVMDGLSGRIDAVLDGGPADVGVESTILGLWDVPRLLRPGGLPAEEIEDALGRPLAGPPDAGAPAAPGMLASHYAPGASVRLGATGIEAGEVLLGFGDAPGAAMNLSPGGDLREAAANLFGYLRDLDGMAPVIAVSPIPETGLGRAINDRLRRAAAPR